MKYLISIFISLLLAAASFSSSAASQPFFEDMSLKDGFDYSFVSPVMLQSMGDNIVNEDLKIRASDIKAIETVSTIYNGTDSEFWKIIRKVKADKKLVTLSTKKQGNYRSDILGKITSDGKYLTNLMVVTQNTGDTVTVVYIEGKIPMSDFYVNF